MKIVSIFAERLFSFHYENEDFNEFERLLDIWTNVSYLKDYAEKNNVEDVEQFVDDRLKEAEIFEDILMEIQEGKEPLETFFRPLFDTEMRVINLSLQKGKLKNNSLRIYAIRIDDDCFLITGGAIKMSQTMQEHPDTEEEYKKLIRAKKHLMENVTFDKDSFFEFLNQ